MLFLFNPIVFIFQASGMKEGDFIVGIAEEDVKWSPHEEVVALIKSSGNNLNLRIVTPVDNRHTPIGKVILKQKLNFNNSGA